MDTNIKTIFLGDSLTFGYGVKKEECWTNKIINAYNLNALNKGINGDTTPSMLSRYDRDVLSHLPNQIFIMGGTNDILLGRTVISIIKNIDLMLQDSLKLNSHIIIGIPPYILGEMANSLFYENLSYIYAEKELQNLRSSLIELCTNYNINYVDFYKTTINKPNIYLDGIHLNTRGHEILYKEALPYFKL